MPIPLVTDQAYGVRKADAVTITSANTATQLMRLPVYAPHNKVGKLRKIIISNTDVSAAQVLIWDADLSNTTPTTRGTGTVQAALLNIGVAAAVNSNATSTTLVIGEADLPAIEFQAGVAAAVNRVNCNIAIEMEIY